jgi:hypothetical protein
VEVVDFFGGNQMFFYAFGTLGGSPRASQLLGVHIRFSLVSTGFGGTSIRSKKKTTKTEQRDRGFSLIF